MRRLLNYDGIKWFVRKQKMKVGRRVLPNAEEKIKAMLQEGVARAKKNRRRTLLGRDL